MCGCARMKFAEMCQIPIYSLVCIPIFGRCTIYHCQIHLHIFETRNLLWRCHVRNVNWMPRNKLIKWKTMAESESRKCILYCQNLQFICAEMLMRAVRGFWFRLVFVWIYPSTSNRMRQLQLEVLIAKSGHDTRYTWISECAYICTYCVQRIYFSLFRVFELCGASSSSQLSFVA